MAGKKNPSAAPRHRLCRTPEDSFQAGWDNAADSPPLTTEQVDRIVALLRPHWRDRFTEHSASA